MKINSNKYFYLNNKETDGAVFQTQILDWLHLFGQNGVSFELIQLFHIKDFIRPNFVNSQIKVVKGKSKIFNGFLFFLPSKGFGAYLNFGLLLIKLLIPLFKSGKVVIFSRAIIGREIRLLKRIFPSKVVFIFDARAASAEENKYSAIKTSDFSKERYLMIGNIYYLEYETILIADKIFSVSNRLSDYFIDNFKIDKNKFHLYPCLSNSSKFKFNIEVRSEIRSEMNFGIEKRVLIYAGGISAEWHLADKMIKFFRELLKFEQNSVFLFLSNDEVGFNRLIQNFPDLMEFVFYKKVPNDLVYKYLNAADFGLLFRDDTIMNNVSSPTKFAEYMLCGLPVLISQGVGDYEKFVSENNAGLVFKTTELENFNNFDFNSFLNKKFVRNEIAQLGQKLFSKEAFAPHLTQILSND
ncbi:MAG: hypothetical protein Q8R57_16435 [Bacteroidota bacterium]|nr:hypothetical protein [Bacteroidota bacterium]